MAIVVCVSYLGHSYAETDTSKEPRLAEAVLINGRQPDTQIEQFLSSSSEELIRWGNPAPIRSSEQILLVDGSLLVPSQAWSPAGKIEVNDTSIKLNREGKPISLSRSDIALIQLQPIAISANTDLLDGANAFDTPLEEDLITLIDGDLLRGEIKQLDGELLKLELYGESIELPIERVALLQFGVSNDASPKQPSFQYLVGLTDGSFLKAASLEISAGRYQIETTSKVTLEGPDDEIAYVQPMNQKVTYLSDLEPIDYQHTPYFSLQWPYGRDRLPVKGRFKAAGQFFAKGVAMHTASRLVYALNANVERFQATIAIADSLEEEPTGSALFQVFVVEAEGIRSIYESPILLSGETPVPIDLKVAGARALVLTVDYADSADIGDDALWLDARLVSNSE